jgi:UDP-N-acetylmuramyl pentapeptide phosphotransferase/UDP-N-acetylglucosamine-1-phosphate transferase
VSPILSQLLMLLALAAIAWGLAHVSVLLVQPGGGESGGTKRHRTGGIGLVVALLATGLAIHFFSERLHSLAGLSSDAIPPLRLAGFGMLLIGGFVIGWLDDRGGIPRAVSVGQLAVLAVGAALMDLHLRQIALPRLGPLDPPRVVGVVLAAAWLLVVMLAVNFVDVLDGLTGRLTNWTALALLFCTINAPWRFELALLAAGLLGVSVALVRINSPLREPSIRLGNSGSFALGGALGGALLLLVADDLRYTGERTYHNNLLTAGLVLSLPIYDFGRTMIGRVFHGRPLFGSQSDGLVSRLHRAVGGNWAETMNVVEPFLITFAILGAAATRLDNPSNPSAERIVLAVLLAATACTIFRLKVRRAEHMAEEGK